ncbi:MAG: class I SAM-dependent methyltransferase [Deltaproteobacteria bacterium]|nr:class I SAM-dependent methyltransferase [Deltaproteobacteria bacterium]
MTEGNVAGNYYDKYNTKNPVARYLVAGFMESLKELTGPLEIKSLVEVGCGEGRVAHFLKELRPKLDIEANDVSPEVIAMAKKEYPGIKFSVRSATDLKYRDCSFDMVVACEVLEHLKDPDAAIREIKRVAGKYAIFSVPREPVWSLLNLARGKYIKDLGNTPGHLQKWGKKGFLTLLGKYFRVERALTPLPWTMALCVKEKR